MGARAVQGITLRTWKESETFGHGAKDNSRSNSRKLQLIETKGNGRNLRGRQRKRLRGHPSQSAHIKVANEPVRGRLGEAQREPKEDPLDSDNTVSKHTHHHV